MTDYEIECLKYELEDLQDRRGSDYSGAKYLSKAIKELELKGNTGHWISWYVEIEYETARAYTLHCRCSACGNEVDTETEKVTPFCPWCGTKMIKKPERRKA